MNQETVRAFAERVSGGDLGPEVQVRYRVAGGMPSQRLECDVVVDAANGAEVTRYDAADSRERTRALIPADEIDVRALFESVSRGLPSLTPAAERVTRSPDSLVGHLTIVVDGAEEVFHVVPERDKRDEEHRVTPAMDRALQRLWELAMTRPRAQGGADRA